MNKKIHVWCVSVCKNHREQHTEQGREKGRGKETEITGIDFLTFSEGDKADRDLPGGEREREKMLLENNGHIHIQW